MTSAGNSPSSCATTSGPRPKCSSPSRPPSRWPASRHALPPPDLRRRRPVDESARPIRQYQAGATLSRLLPPSPATPGSGCLQLHPAAATARRWTVSHLHPEQQRLVAHPRSCQNGRETAVTSGHPWALRTTSDLGMRRLTPCLKRPVTKLLASPVTVWNRRRCLRLAQRGQCTSDKPVGDHGGSLACSRRVSSIRGRHVSGLESSKQRVAPWACLMARSETVCYPILALIRSARSRVAWLQAADERVNCGNPWVRLGLCM